MANDSDKIIVGANGTVYVAVTTTAAPTGVRSALAGGFKAVGFVSENGVMVSPSQQITPIMAWQSAYPVRKIVTSRGLELDFVLREFNAETLPFAFGGGSITGSHSAYTYTPPDPETLDVRSLIVDWQDGTKDFRLYVPNGQVTDLAAFTLSRTAPAELPIKFELNHSGVGEPWTLFSNDNALGS